MRWGLYVFCWLTSLGGSALAQGAPDLKELAATILNLNGFLCATVVDIRPLEIKDQFEITCIEYRGGSGTVRYILNGATNKAFKAD
jgi:hypothetical protein